MEHPVELGDLEVRVGEDRVIDLAAADLGKTDPTSDQGRILTTTLKRGRNRVVGALKQARRVVQAVG